MYLLDISGVESLQNHGIITKHGKTATVKYGMKIKVFGFDLFYVDVVRHLDS